MSSAIVTGATGIIGREIVRALGQDPKQWHTIHALSRSQKEQYPSNVKHDTMDLGGNSTDMAKQLQGIEAEYIFFAAYLEKDTDKELWDVNGAMLKNLLEALEMTGAIKKLRRVVLTAGAKQYGVQLGPAKIPMEESDPWLDGLDWPLNFYYNQQNILKEMSAHASWDWVVTYPSHVIGVAKGNFMNIGTSLGIYAAISKELGDPLLFPGNEKLYMGFDCFSYSRLHASFNLWAALEPKCSNQAFNFVNGDVESWSNLWPKLANRFDCEIPESQFSFPIAQDAGSVTDLLPRPPMALHAAQRGIADRVRPGKVEQRLDLVKWSQRADVKKAWESLSQSEGLAPDGLEKATWRFLGFILGKNYDMAISMSKARKFGWTGYIDTWDAFSECFDELEAEKVLPKKK